MRYRAMVGLSVVLLAGCNGPRQFFLGKDPVVEQALPRVIVDCERPDASHAYPVCERSPTEVHEVPVLSLTHLASQQPADLRKALRKVVARAEHSKLGLASLREINDKQLDADYAALRSVSTSTHYVIELPFGIRNRVSVFEPSGSTNKRHLVLYHQGHQGHPKVEMKTIAGLLHKGYTVAAFSLPLLGTNSAGEIEGHRLTTHADLAHVDSLRDRLGYSSLTLFVEPLERVLDLLLARFSGYEVAMVGLSGGGWTTLLFSALDTRVEKSVVVAGSLPFLVREDPGDYEQRLPWLSQVANYFDTSMLSVHPAHRQQLHIYIYNDPCCFARAKHRMFDRELKAFLESDGRFGSWSTLVDVTTRTHEISPWALEQIIRFLE